MIIAGQPQHVIVRGNNRSEIFCCAADYRFYLRGGFGLGLELSLFT